MLDQRRAKVSDCRGSDLPCADHAWSSMISHVQQRSSRRESRWWFFFLSRLVSIYLSISRGIKKSIYLSMYIQRYQKIYLSIYIQRYQKNLSIYLYPEVSKNLSIYLYPEVTKKSIYLSISRGIKKSIYLSTSRGIKKSIYLSISRGIKVQSIKVAIQLHLFPWSPRYCTCFHGHHVIRRLVYSLRASSVQTTWRKVVSGRFIIIPYFYVNEKSLQQIQCLQTKRHSFVRINSLLILSVLFCSVDKFNV